MIPSVSLTFRHLLRTWALESSAREIGNRLHQLHARMTACHIVLEGGGNSSRDGSFKVKIHLSVPGGQIHAESSHAEAKNPLHSAYENAKRQIEKLKQMQADPMARDHGGPLPI